MKRLLRYARGLKSHSIGPMPATRTLPKEDVAPAWSALMPPRAPCPRLQNVIRADWAVLGAGFTGVAAARRLAERRPQDKIVVVDASVVGEGAAGRNSGFAIDHAHALGNGAASAASMQAQKRLYTAAIDQMREIVAANAIDCDWRDDGKYHAASSARGAEEILRPLAADMENAGLSYRWLDKKATRDELGVGTYHAAVYTPGSALVNPAALIRGLADALPENVALYEQTPVTEIEDGERVVVKTPQGRIDADGLVLAANAYTPALGFCQSELLPCVAFASLTHPMSKARQAALGGKRSWGVTPANAFVGATIRRTPDQRILFRYGIGYRPGLRYSAEEIAAVRRRHLELFRKQFPMLEDLELDLCWGGFMCVSANQHSAFGKIGRRIWTAAGHQGVGVTRGTIAGALAADFALGENNPLIADMMTTATPTKNPPRPLLDVGVSLHMAWDAWRNNHEAA